MISDLPQFLVWLAASSAVAVVLVWLVTSLFWRMSAAWKNLLWRLAVITPLVVAPVLLSGLRVKIPVARPVAQKAIAPASAPAAVPSAVANDGKMPAQAPLAAKVSASTVAAVVWSSGAFLIAGLFVVQHARLRRQFRFSRKAELGPDESQAMSLAMVDVVTHATARVPFCYGVLRPLIVLPAHFSKLSRSERWICLVHELTHIRRGDLGWLALAQLACAVCWFNPLMWFAFSRLKNTAELATDDAILGEKATPASYAQTLLAVSELAGSNKTPAGVWAMARAGSLKARLSAILDPATRRHTPGQSLSVAVLTAYLVVTAIASSVRTVEAAQSPQAAAIPNPADVTVDQLANFLSVDIWKSRVTLPMGKFSATVFRIVDGKVREPVVTYLPPYNGETGMAEPQISIFSAPQDDGTKIQMRFEWNGESGSGSVATRQTVPPRKPGKYGTFTVSLPETISEGDYPLGGEAPSEKGAKLHLVESYVDGLALRIERSNGQVAIYVKKDGSLMFKEKIITIEELTVFLERLIASNPTQVAIVSENGRDDPLAIKVRDICASVGITDVLLASAPPN